MPSARIYYKWVPPTDLFFVVAVSLTMPTPGALGACAMTTKFLDNRICTFKILLSWCFPQNTAFFGQYSSLPPRPTPPPFKSAHFISIVVSPSLSHGQVSENSRRLWLPEIPCWKSFSANFDAAGKFFTAFPAARNAILAKVWAFSVRALPPWDPHVL